MSRFNQSGNAKPLWFLSQPVVGMDWFSFKNSIFQKLNAVEAAAIKASGSRIISNKDSGKEWTSIFGSKVVKNDVLQQPILNNEN